MDNYERALDNMFGALSDITRRQILQRLGQRDLTVSEIAEPLAISLPGVLKHLSALESAGLIEREKLGRTVTCRMVRERLHQAERWLQQCSSFWNNQLDRLERHMKSSQAQEQPWKRATKPSSKSSASSKPRARASTVPGRTRKS